MKKSLAFTGTSVLGLAAVALAAPPATAAEPLDPETDACGTVDDHIVTVGGDLHDNWYMDCIPQYGLGKVDFTIESDVPFPAGFEPLGSAAVTSAAVNTGDDARTYFGGMGSTAGFGALNQGTSTDTTQEYSGNMYFAITSVGSILPSELPEACQAEADTFANAYVINYAPATVTFTQEIAGEEWRYDVTAAPGPMYLGLNILNTGLFDPASAQCASDGTSTLFVESDVESDNEFENIVAHATSTFGEYLDPYVGSSALGTFERYVAPVDPAEDPTLPATGVNPAGAAGLAAAFIGLGVLGGYLRRRESRV